MVLYNAQFEMTNLREISHYLDIEIDIEVRKKISFCQITYFRKILEYYQMANSKPTSIIISPNVINSLFLSDS